MLKLIYSDGKKYSVLTDKEMAEERKRANRSVIASVGLKKRKK